MKHCCLQPPSRASTSMIAIPSAFQRIVSPAGPEPLRKPSGRGHNGATTLSAKNGNTRGFIGNSGWGAQEIFSVFAVRAEYVDEEEREIRPRSLQGGTSAAWRRPIRMATLNAGNWRRCLVGVVRLA